MMIIRIKYILLLGVLFIACKNDAPAPKATESLTPPPTNKIIPAAKPTKKIAAKLDTVTVSSIEELVENAKNNTVVIMETGTYTLEKDIVYYMTKDERKIIDKKVVDTKSIGGQLYLSGFTDFQIIGKKGVNIVSENPQAVAFFSVRGNNLKFSNLTIRKDIIGTTDLCYISNSKNVEIDRFNIQGGGTYGINMYNVDNVKVNNTKISKCSTGVMRLIESRGVQFLNSTFSNNVCKVPLVNLYSTGSTVSFNNVTISDNQKDPKSTFENSDRLFAINGNSMRLDNCTIRNNKGYTSLGINQNMISRSQVEGVNY